MNLKSTSQKTQKTYLAVIARLAEHFGVSPERLTEEQIREYLISRRKELRTNSMRPELGAIKFFYRYTVPRDWPALQAMKLPKSRTIPNVLLPEDCWNIIAEAKSLHLRAAFQTAYTCGLRVSDVCQLQPGDIDAARRMLVVRRTKGLNERTLPLPDNTLNILRAYWCEHRNREWLFPSRARNKQIAAAKTPSSERTLQRGLASVLETLGWQDRKIVFHTLRHSYATAMLDEGINLKVLQRYLGHKNLQATEVYLHLSRRANERAQQIVHRTMNGPPEIPTDKEAAGRTD